ncbi:ABC transporter substrate-binding protein [Teredinibacter purpureus]|uniref:ABC transporter substrate-binding protein n=1 Tax=Teredinibacter purpureus TaxID=2731756 RepID=UPI000AA252A0|nr:hypothetical protein [Teredinibacter purpureus]
MRQSIRTISMLLFLLSTSVLVLLNSAKQKRIFILHSYNTDYAWTQQVNAGIRKAIAENANIASNYDVRYYYMNAKNIPFETAEDAQDPTILAKKSIDLYQPDILIAFDDIAQQYVVAPYYLNKPDMRIVFSGVNGDINNYCMTDERKPGQCYNDAQNVQGTLERIPVASVVEVIRLLKGRNKSLHGNHTRVHFLQDASATAKQDAEYLASVERKPDWKEVEFSRSPIIETFSEWQEYVAAITKDNADFLLVDGYRKLKLEKPEDTIDGMRLYADPADVADWTERNASVPIIGLNGFSSEDGFMLSVGVSPYELGRRAYRQAAQPESDDGANTTTEKIGVSHQYLVAVNACSLARRGVTLPNILEVFARTTDQYYTRAKGCQH